MAVWCGMFSWCPFWRLGINYLKPVGWVEGLFHSRLERVFEELWSFFRAEGIYIHNLKILNDWQIWLSLQILAAKLNELNTELQGKNNILLK